ncbi:MAG TPA: PEP-CTERM sorting domain-containing protein [Lacunisphaera sp.]|jgi:hypothetical protein|nr:PEP-CTERM sorting domain-containing protein [Lacunisphaera sp.]
MDATTAQPTLLSAARNFIRKSAGTAVLAIAPLAAVAIAPEAKAQTTFGTPGINIGYGTGSASISDSFPVPNRFFFAGSPSNNLTTTRLGVDGTLSTTMSGSAIVTLTILSAITALDIPASTIIPVAYDFSLSKTGIAGNVSWSLSSHITGDNFVNIANGTLTTGSATFTGTGNYTTAGNVLSDGSKNLEFILTLNYSTSAADVLAVQMNSASQGFTINAVPEPSTYALLLGLGALGFLTVRRARRVRAA